MIIQLTDKEIKEIGLKTNSKFQFMVSDDEETTYCFNRLNSELTFFILLKTCFFHVRVDENYIYTSELHKLTHDYILKAINKELTKFD